MNSCMIFFIIFEVMAVVKVIEITFIEGTTEQNTMNDIFFWMAQGFAVTFIQLNNIIQLLGK